MQDVGDGSLAGRRRLSAIQGERDAPSVGPDPSPVLPASRLLEAATALSEGAVALHTHLRRLDPDARDAVLDAMAEQMGEFVRLWIDLVRAVVEDDDDGDERPAAPRAVPSRRATSAPVRPTRAGDNHPARIAVPLAEHVPEPTSAPLRHEPLTEGRDHERATRDELTGVLNRNAGFTALEREIDRCRRGGERFVLGYLNVDAMTAINDTRGLRAGDEVLRKVTAALRATLRSYDVIARLGGDEFLFSLPGSDLATAELRFKEFAVILAEEAPGCTASVGFAELHQHDALDDLVATAETAMLKGRRTRRRGRT